MISPFTHTLTPLFTHDYHEESDGERDGRWWALLGPFLARAEVRLSNLGLIYLGGRVGLMIE